MRWVESGDVRLAVFEEGDPADPTVVLVHGYPDTHRVWDEVARRLRDRFHVVRYDVRGAGASTAPRGRHRYRLRPADRRPGRRAGGDRQAPGPPGRATTGARSRAGPRWPGPASANASPPSPASAARDRASSATSCGTAGGARSPRSSPGPGTSAPSSSPCCPSWPGARSCRGSSSGRCGSPKGWSRDPGTRRTPSATTRATASSSTAPTRSPRGATPCVDVPVQLIECLRDPFVTPALLRAQARGVARLWHRTADAGHWVQRGAPDLIARMIGEFAEHIEGGEAARGLRTAKVTQGRKAFTGRLVVVTGAGSGIGRATARAFAAHGAEVGLRRPRPRRGPPSRRRHRQGPGRYGTRRAARRRRCRTDGGVRGTCPVPVRSAGHRGEQRRDRGRRGASSTTPWRTGARASTSTCGA